MVSVFVEQVYRASLDGWIDCRHLEETVACLDIHRVQFIDATFSDAGDRVICEFLAPDIESVRHALRGAGIDAATIKSEPFVTH